jgi:peptidoglycan/xylan/chitin deacetylase (PgdA/CDA1 family)
MTGTVFLTVGKTRATHPQNRLPSMGGETLMNWQEIREMEAAGFQLGAHTLTHPDLTAMTVNRAIHEVYGSKAIIEEALGEPVKTFAYPYGYHNQQIRNIADRFFESACSARLGLVSHRSDPYALERIDTYYLRTDRLFKLVTSGVFPWYTRLRGLLRRARYLIVQKKGMM